MDIKPEPPVDIASMTQVKRIIRRKLRRIEPEEENFLNIYPMMDMMTILLVFLIMQFAAATADVIPTDNLRIPYSTSDLQPEDAVAIQIAFNEIVVDKDRILGLQNRGQVDASQKQGGGTGFLITPLLDVMEKKRERQERIAAVNPNRPFRGEVRIIADKRIPFRTLSEVIYTVGQAGFNTLRFVVLQEGG